MIALKLMYEELGFRDITTYIQSGNVVFRASQLEPPRKLGSMIRKKITLTFGFDVPVIVRTLDDWNSILNTNPFHDDPEIDRDKLYVTLLEDEPDPARVTKLKPADYLPEKFIWAGMTIYLYCPNGYGRTKLNNNFFEQKLKVAATTRNWKTMIALRDIASKT